MYVWDLQSGLEAVLKTSNHSRGYASSVNCQGGTRLIGDDSYPSSQKYEILSMNVFSVPTTNSWARLTRVVEREGSDAPYGYEAGGHKYREQRNSKMMLIALVIKQLAPS